MLLRVLFLSFAALASTGARHAAACWLRDVDAPARSSLDLREWRVFRAAAAGRCRSIGFADLKRSFAPGDSGLLTERIHLADQRNGWAAGMHGTILRSRDGGATWESQPAPAGARLTSIDFSSDGTDWIAEEYNLFRSGDAGETWRAVPLQAPMAVTRVAAIRDSAWAVGLGVIPARSGGDEAWRRADTDGNRKPGRSGRG